MRYKNILKSLVCTLIDVGDYRTNVDEHSAAVRVVTLKNMTYVALFEQPPQIWKYVSIYKHHSVSDDWTLEDAQQVVV